MQLLKAHVHNGRLVLDEPSDLPEGEVVYLRPADPLVEAGYAGWTRTREHGSIRPWMRASPQPELAR